ncbi:MAG: hypothetical protein ACK4SF_04350 [Algoriphagus aquaeductus]|uniref:hypothetical protein n=1 Tax=Algoriphagus aquaeductus TaxID=475299 RepID=UPI003919E6CF
MAIDPLAIPVGLEGFTIYETGATDYTLATGLEGFVLIEVEPFPRFPNGFEGFLFTFDAVERFIKVTDFRGRPIRGVTVTAQNAGGNVSDTTGEDGIAALNIDTAGTVTIRLQKEKIFKTLPYTHATEAILKEVVLQPPLM